MSRIGIRSCALGGMLDSDGLRKVRDIGFDALELSFNRGSHLDCNDRTRGVRMRVEAERLNLMLTAHAPEEAWLSDPDKVSAVSAALRLSETMGKISHYGARTLVVHACPYRPAVPGQAQAQMDSLCSALEILGRRAGKYGICILVETLTRQSNAFTSHLDNILVALDRIGSPWVKICVDTNHLNTMEPLPTGIRRIGGRLAECHCNDNHGMQEEHLLPFDGSIDWAEFASALAAIRFDGPLIIEPGHCDESRLDDLLTAASAAACRLRTCLAAAFSEQAAANRRS